MNLPHVSFWAAFHLLAVAVGLLLYVKRSRTVGRYRTPGSAFAWVLALIVLPYVALPMFYVFARRKQDHITALPWRSPQTNVAQGSDQLPRAIGLPPIRLAPTPQIYSVGSQALDALVHLIKSATKAIQFETFIFADDDSGTRVVDALVQAQNRGIKVQILVDELGNHPSMRKITQRMRDNHLDLKPFGKVRGLRSLATGNLRNHRKQVIVDGETLWCGGRNIANEYFDSVADNGWTDLTFTIQGELVDDAATVFQGDWDGTNASSAPFQTSNSSEQASHAVRLVPSGPDFKFDTQYELLLEMIGKAERRVWIATPYYVPDDTLQNAVTRARLRGADVQLLTPAKSNHGLADFARKRSLRDLHANQVVIHLLPFMSHAKLVIIDDVAICGSHNFDTRSLFLNYEMSVQFLDNRDVDVFARWYVDQVKVTTLADPQPPTLPMDLAEGLVRSLAYQL